MSDLAVTLTVDVDNPVEHDLRLENGQFILVDGAEEIAQHIKTRLQFFRGDWFLDLREGIPYFEEVFIKNPNMGLLRGMFRRVIAETPGVDSVQTLALSLDTPTRSLSLTFKAVLTSGEVFDSSDFGPFLVEV